MYCMGIKGAKEGLTRLESACVLLVDFDTLIKHHAVPMAASRQQAGALRTTKTAARHKQVRERRGGPRKLRPPAEYLPTTQPLQLFGRIIDLPLPPPRRSAAVARRYRSHRVSAQ